MASMAFASSFIKLQATNRLPFILSKPCSSRVFFPASNTPNFHGNKRYGTMAYDDAANQGRDAARKGVDAAKKGGQQVQKEAVAAVDNAGEKIDDMAGKASGTAQDAAGKAKQTAADAAGKVKQTAQDAWGTVKDTAQNIKETVVGKAEFTAESAKDACRRRS
ncbi:hypothetical protein OROGR_002746 [Orobanche gracilis]